MEQENALMEQWEEGQGGVERDILVDNNDE
jgi:hypothetical protein